jgi:hypothetical protein
VPHCSGAKARRRRATWSPWIGLSNANLKPNNSTNDVPSDVVRKGLGPGEVYSLLISAGEGSYEALAEQWPGKTSLPLIEVSLPSEPTQLLDRLAKKGARAKPRQRLRENTAMYYGTVGHAFIKRLVAEMAVHKSKLVTRIQRDIAELLAIVHVDVNDELQLRRGKFLGLAYAAGLLAIDYGVLPWDRSLLKRSIRRCYRCIPGQSGMPADPIRRAAARVIRRVGKIEDVVDISEGRGSIDPDLAESARVLLTTHSDGSALLDIRPDFFRSITGSKVAAPSVARHLEQQGILVGRTNGRRTRQIRIPGATKRRDFYCLKLDRVQARTERTKRKSN